MFRKQDLTCQCRLMAMVCIVIWTVLPIKSQTISDAENAYKELTLMRTDTSVSKVVFYAKVMSVTKAFRQQLLSTPSGVNGYAKAQSMLKSLFPFVRSGAGYYSQNHQDSMAVLFAKTAVDIAMMQEMRDQGLRKSPPI